MVSDGKTFAQRDSDAGNRSIELLDSRSLTYRQVNVQPGRFRVTKTYVTDPARHVLLVDVRFRSLTGKRLSSTPSTTRASETTAWTTAARSSGKALLASDAGSPVSSALIGSPAFVQTSNGYARNAERRLGGPEGLPHGREVRGRPRTATWSRRLARGSPAWASARG